ncbi:hypothetical protein Tco_0753615 [Tanacetum coccineum]
MMTEVVTELVVKECLEKAMTSSDSSLGKPRIDIDLTTELSMKISRELHVNTFFGKEEEDVVDHVANFLGILDQIKFRIGKNYKIINFDGDGPEYYEFMTWLDSKFKDKIKIYMSTKTALWHSWVKGWGNESIGDTELSDEEWDKDDYGNPPNAISVPFFKPYLDA